MEKTLSKNLAGNPFESSDASYHGAFGTKPLIAKPLTLGSSESKALWNSILERCAFAPVVYNFEYATYEKIYSTQESTEIQDLSCVLELDGKPVGVWPLYAHMRERFTLESLYGDILPPLLIDGLHEGEEKKILHACLDWISLLCKTLDIPSYQTRETPYLASSLWSRALLRKASKQIVTHELYLDLTPDFAAIKSSFRQSYKSLINSGLRTYDVTSFSTRNDFAEFRELHQKVAGRITRNDATWAAQWQAVEQGSAILVTLRAKTDHRLVGGGFFNCSKDESKYSVGVFDRELFDQPLGHLVQYEAIRIMKERGIRRYYLGQQHFDFDDRRPDAKEKQISYFKEGFASSFPLCLRLIIPEESHATT